jgi:hypothetical protein
MFERPSDGMLHDVTRQRMSWVLALSDDGRTNAWMRMRITTSKLEKPWRRSHSRCFWPQRFGDVVPIGQFICKWLQLMKKRYAKPTPLFFDKDHICFGEGLLKMTC